MIIITFFRRFSGLGCAFALILIAGLLAGPLSNKETHYNNELLYLADQSAYADKYDCFDRKVESVNDQFGNRFLEAVVYADEGVDRYQLQGNYVLSGTVFLCEHIKLNMRGIRILIYGDGQLLWASSIIQNGSPSEDFNIALTGVKELEIRRIGSGNKLGIGNFSLQRVSDGQTPSAPGYTRLLDVPCDSTFRCRYTDHVQRDAFGNQYADTILYQYGTENFHDDFYLNGQFDTLSGTENVAGTKSWATSMPHSVQWLVGVPQVGLYIR